MEILFLGYVTTDVDTVTRVPSSPPSLLQGRIQKYGLGGHEGVGLVPFPSPSRLLPFPSPPLPLEVGPLNPANGSGGALLAPPTAKIEFGTF